MTAPARPQEVPDPSTDTLFERVLKRMLNTPHEPQKKKDGTRARKKPGKRESR